MTELLIYTPQTTQRVTYIFQLFFDSLIKTPYRITNDQALFKTYTGPKLNYSSTLFNSDELQIPPVGLLTETEIKTQPIEVTEWNNLKIFYRTDKGSLPFDIFSASFYLVSRYEEYSSHHADTHRRFRHENSLAFKNHFLDEPLVNLWAEELKKIILKKYPSTPFSGNTYSFVPTMDIDVAYAHLGRNIILIIGSYIKAIYKFHIRILFEKTLVLLRLKKDPYDTFNYQKSLFKKYNIRPVYFFLAGKRSHYDHNISPENNKFKKLVKKLSSFAEIGIHPSYQSDSNPEIVAKEIKNVEQNIPRKIIHSRQHFLRMQLPGTYRCLAELGITDDYTMAYAGVVGFRAGICTPFFFYDLQAESILPIKIHSTAVMDGTLNDYLKLTARDAIAVTKELLEKVKKCGGEFIVI